MKENNLAVHFAKGYRFFILLTEKSWVSAKVLPAFYFFPYIGQK